jgi:hypothetical protein
MKEMIMNRITKYMVAGMGMFIALGNIGCASYLVQDHYQEEMKQERREARAVQARAIGKDGNVDGVAFGVDVADPTVWETIKAHPVATLVGAVVDGGVAYGAYKAIDSGNGNDSKEDSKPAGGGNNSGRDTVVINGDGNYVNTSTTTFAPPVTE